MYQEHGIRPGAWGNAIDYWTRPNSTMLKYYVKVPGSKVRAGDFVVLWGHTGNPYGHIGVATGRSNTSSVEILEQNGSTGNGSGTGGDAIRTRYVPRSRVAGLIRRKSTTAPKQYVTVQRGWGLSNVAKTAGFKDWFLPTRWAYISKLNTGSLNWAKFNASLKPGQRVRVR